MYIAVNDHARSLITAPTALIHRRLWVVLCAVVVLAAMFVLPRLAGVADGRMPEFRFHARSAARPASPTLSQTSLAWTDTFKDGTPDFLRLSDPADQATFRRWFTLIAEYQTIRPKAEVPAEITDCASLLRYSYRETLRRHDAGWFVISGIEVQTPPGEIRAWSYPYSPLGTALFRVKPGAFAPNDLSDGAFAQFADAKTLVERNAYLVSRDVRAALPGDLLFYRQFGQSSPWHSMIVTRSGAAAEVVYDTGPDHGQSPHGRRPVRGGPGQPGEIRRVLLSELLDHPQPQWRPLAGNPNFLGVYRWNILRGTP
ncbi:MAG: DUF1175 family protein [Terracidiphilus sp.]